MPFQTAKTITPTRIGGLWIHVGYDVPIYDAESMTTTIGNFATYEVEVLDQDGNRVREEGDIGDLVEVLTTTELQQLIAFVKAQKDKATAAFIP